VKEPCVGTASMRASIGGELKKRGITEVDADAITGSELVLINTVLSSSDSDAAKTAQIKRIVASDTPIRGADQIRTDAGQCVRAVNADLDLEMLTPDELIQIQLIGRGSDDANTKRTMMEKLAK
jgi:hypothetical protein